MATKKRTTKQQRENQQLKALTQRISDIYCGASGGVWNEEEECPTAEQLSVIGPAVRSTFQGENVPEWVWDFINLDKFERPSVLAKQLFEYGVRA
ncbi:hypothetical protein [Candidatus Macondimonas diazotrophica]|uniref:Uncharacterized protein n=1 Tax=Candidatus Macondimonas diazotrophica TaxID=2305248 RepID=A0A4Z0F718_9GAMM|nr:hypothetical protein [Candidatus Macondimonas diazotrophica]TFZ81451.1 hypothetical protein E4680_12285 [Candidatus Macondimonas diazotrophica]